MNSKVQEIINKEFEDQTGVLNFHDCPLYDWSKRMFEITWLKVLRFKK